MLAMGCMRLSTDPDRDEERSIAVLHAALDAGVELLDTADAYCHDAADAGHNERLIARALASWNGDRSRVRVATKGGLTRPGGQWAPDARAKSLVAACQASLRALDVERIDLYQLHAPDPQVPLATSVRALDALERDGLIGAIGLSNVTVGQIEQAREITAIDAVQVELSLWHDANILSGVVDYCLVHEIRLLAYRPLGGTEHHRRAQSDPVLTDIARAHAATPFEVALAWLHGISELIVPLPGPTRVDTVRSIAQASGLALTAEDRARLAEHFPACRALAFRESVRTARGVRDGEIVIIMGLPGAGKSTVAEALVAGGYQRLNRDEAGGSLRKLLPALDRAVAAGSSRIVLDNTYISRRARAEVIQAAWQHRLPIRCVWLATSVEDAQVNAVSRMLARHGRLLGPDEMKRASGKDPSVFPPTVQFRYQRELEPPDVSEGFSRVERVEFERRGDPSFANRAVILWCDGILFRSRSGKRAPMSVDDLDVIPGRADILRRYQDAGWRTLGMSWLPEVADGTLTAEDARAILSRARELLEVSIEIEHCPHGAGPPACWCRKPLPGLGVAFVTRHRLNPSECIYVGSGTQDPGLARRLSFQYRDAGEFFRQ
jgi:aryl-alcohol dehydrogenase-like predicted oxidoreductase/histidinol phosphatase-like enzyme/predicted kinase